MGVLTSWTFRTRNFTVRWQAEEDFSYRYDGDDPDGEVQAKLDTGEYVAFDSKVSVLFRGGEIAASYLGGSVYAWDKVATFRDHIGSQGKHGSYFTDMVHEAIQEARRHFTSLPKIKPPKP